MNKPINLATCELPCWIQDRNGLLCRMFDRVDGRVLLAYKLMHHSSVSCSWFRISALGQYQPAPWAIDYDSNWSKPPKPEYRMPEIGEVCQANIDTGFSLGDDYPYPIGEYLGPCGDQFAIRSREGNKTVVTLWNAVRVKV
jgi:hypothetical protein